MKTGTKSLLIGVHQFLWHPITVLLAWHELYGWPTWKELICIIVHDWGYWGSPDMDDEVGNRHPVRGAEIAHRYLDHGTYGGFTYYYICLLHSRHMADEAGFFPSRLCWADKLSCKYDPWWLYLPRAILSGEIHEYRKHAAEFGTVPLSASHREWYRLAQSRMIGKAYRQDSRPAYEAGS
jgi:hypothetical protein